MRYELSQFFGKFANKKSKLTIPEIAAIGGTRALLGAGVGLLLAGKLKGNSRKLTGLTLFLIGAASTVPLVRNVLSKSS